MAKPTLDRTTTDATGMSQSRVSSMADGHVVEAIACARLDFPGGQWKASVRLSPPPSPQEGWPAESLDALSAVVLEACAEARRLLAARTA